MTHQPTSRSQGFTLIEMLVYIALVTLVMVPALSMTWMFVQDHIFAERLAALDDEGMFILQTITNKGKSANALHGASVWNTNPGKLVLTMANGDIVTIDTYQKTIVEQGQPRTITALRVTTNSDAPMDLTSTRWTVTKFTLQNLSSLKASTINITLGLAAANPTSSPYDVERTWTTSLTLWP